MADWSIAEKAPVHYSHAMAEPSSTRRRRSDGTAGANGRATNTSKKPAAKVWVATNRPDAPLAGPLAAALVDLQTTLDMPVWLLLHNGRSASMDYTVLRAFLETRRDLPKRKKVALVIDSPGGYADVAYRVARLFARHSEGFVAVIPRWAKSAGTLLTLGAEEVIMARDAEIGPLDVQVYDEEREQRGSALDEIQALEQLHQVALMQLNQNVTLMRFITRRRYDVVLPHASKLASDMMAPMLDKIDTVHYAKQSRLLAVAEEYALRLMSPRLGKSEARRIAERLVKGYPEHGFVIDRREAASMLNLVDHNDEVEAVLRRIEMQLWEHDINAFGRFKERS